MPPVAALLTMEVEAVLRTIRVQMPLAELRTIHVKQVAVELQHITHVRQLIVVVQLTVHHQRVRSHLRIIQTGLRTQYTEVHLQIVSFRLISHVRVL